MARVIFSTSQSMISLQYFHVLKTNHILRAGQYIFTDLLKSLTNFIIYICTTDWPQISEKLYHTPLTYWMSLTNIIIRIYYIIFKNVLEKYGTFCGKISELWFFKRYTTFLSNIQSQGIITCLTKVDKLRHFLKNWRPITLLNTSYKIAAGSITNRFKTVLKKRIDFDQSGFVPGRFIGESTCLALLYDIIQYAEEINLQL